MVYLTYTYLRCTFYNVSKNYRSIFFSISLSSRKNDVRELNIEKFRVTNNLLEPNVE